MKTRSEHIKEQIEAAKNTLDNVYNGERYGMNTVITSTKFNTTSKKERFGFHFEPENTMNVGDIIVNKDNSISKVEAIL